MLALAGPPGGPPSSGGATSRWMSPHTHRDVATGTVRSCHDPVPCPQSLPERGRPRRIGYGEHPSQFGELTLPAGDGEVRGVAVVVHGGFWRQAYGLELGRPLAADLAAAGLAAWNIEYRRVGTGGGGWTATFDDVGGGAGCAGRPGQQAAGGRLALDRVVAVGHSAGGHLAAWLAARPGAAGRARPAPAPPCGCAAWSARPACSTWSTPPSTGSGRGAVEDLLGGRPDRVPERYALASPTARLPTRGAGGVRARHRGRQRADPAERAVRGRGMAAGDGRARHAARGGSLRGDRPVHRRLAGLPGRGGTPARLRVGLTGHWRGPPSR